MVIDTGDELRDRIKALLSGQGYTVEGFDRPTPGLAALGDSKSAPFFLIIAGFAMSEMQGDILLAKAREISPDTRRILIADAAYIETMVSAINTARIHSCLTQPFEDRDLVNQVDQCRQQFKAELKKKALKQTIQRQNRQLFQIAGNFKKKQSADLAQVEARKKEIRILESRLKAGQVTGTADRIPGLNEIIDDKNTKYTAQGFGLDFQNVKSQVKEILETALFSQGLSPVSLSYQDVVFRSGLDRQYPGLVQKMLPPVRMLLHQSHEAGTNVFGIDFKRYMDAHFKLSFSDNRAKAFLKLTVKNPKLMNQTCIRYYLSWYKITYGIAPGTKIDAWLAVAAKAEDAGKTAPLVIAHGMDPVYPVDGEIRYHFPTDFLHAGKVDDDGSINFRDRGEIPFVKTNTFLAAKGDAETGKPGIDVTGKEIPVPEPVDRTFEAGPGTTLSQDGKKIYAACDGQPHLDATGKVSVCPEMKIEGDLGFETGDVIFDGNVVVSGVVKQGFKVKGASLTAREINGAEIDLTGDLNVSFGIVDTDLVNVKGSVQAKFIHNSKINAFGDLIVQREIIDSTIRLSGACINTNGNIINSEISANMGIDAGNIGTDTAEPSKLSVGKDEHTLRLVAGLDAKIRQNLEAAALLHKEITDLEKEDQELHGAIAHHATVQDRAELGLKTIKEKMAGLKASGNMAALQKVRKAVSQIEEDARNAEESINKGFERQDGIAREITQKKERITQFEDLNTGLEDDKKRLLEYTETKQPKAQVRVAKKIRSGTKILGPNTTLTLYNNDVRCRIVEMAVKGEDIGGLLYHEMKITSY